MRVGRTREFALLLRAGAKIPSYDSGYEELPPYLDAVDKAGGYERYERAHRTRLAAIFLPTQVSRLARGGRAPHRINMGRLWWPLGSLYTIELAGTSPRWRGVVRS